MPESVRAGLLAPGPFDGVTAAAAGPLVFAARAGGPGRVWDLASGRPVGAPVPDLSEPWTFGLLPAGPALAWSHRDRVHVRVGGAETVVEPDNATPPELLGLAVHRGRGAVVAVFGPARDAEIAVWDAASGARLAAFGVWLGHRAALDRRLLHAPPAAGPLIGLTCDSDRESGTPHLGVLDVERGEEVGRVPCAGPGRPALTMGPDGLIIVQPAEGGLHVRIPGGPPARLSAPGRPDLTAAVWSGGGLQVAADDGGAVLVWRAPDPRPARRVTVPAPVNDVALAAGGTLVIATDDGLYRAP